MTTDPSGRPLGASKATTEWHESRTAANEAQFLLPYLTPGMSLLDVGSGPGTITAGLAEAVAPGQVIGVDLDPARVERAAAAAKERGIDNLSYQTANAYDLPFDDATFDVVFENAMLLHVSDPTKVVGEVHRVLKAGGLFATREGDHDARLWGNASEGVNEFRRFIAKARAHQGTNQFLGKHLRRLLREAGFSDVAGTASCEAAGTLQETAKVASTLIRVLEEPDIAEFAVQEYGDLSKVDAMKTALREWGEHPDSLHVLMFCEAVGRKPN